MSIERLKPDQWKRLRDMRLRLLAADPDSFGSTLALEQSFTDEEWAAKAQRPEAATFLISEMGTDFGISVGAPYRHHGRDCAGLYSMWVDSAMRGKGFGGQLVDAVIAWAKDADYQELCLEVGDHNTAAIALYESRSFVPTGNTFTLDPPRGHITEHERMLVLRV